MKPTTRFIDRIRSLPKPVFFGVLIVVLLLVFSGIRNRTANGRTTTTVDRGSISEFIKVSGNLISVGQTPIYSFTTGTVTEIYVENGDTVKQGDRLFAIRSTASPIQKQEAYAAYQAAITAMQSTIASKPLLQSQLESARKNVIDAAQAVQTMTDRRNVSQPNPSTGLPYTQNEIDSINSTLTSARQAFESLESQYLNADTSITSSKGAVAAARSVYEATRDTTITAPTDGIIANLAAIVGGRVSATAVELGAKNEALCLIMSETPAMVRITVNESDVAQMKVGLDATITFDAFPEKTLKGNVVRIDDVGTNDNGVITYKAYVGLDVTSIPVRNGMTATVTITSRQEKNALRVPNGAVMKKDGKLFVTVTKQGRKEDVQIDTGLKDGSYTQIIRGLDEGQTIETFTQ